jgi:prevent-host-death family protein
MKRVKIAELKSQLSRHLRAVERGAEIEITDRDRPIARIVPIRAEGALSLIAPAEATVAALRAKRPRPAGWRRSSLSLLLEDRRSR